MSTPPEIAGAKLRPIRGLGPDPVEARLEVHFPKDVEDKRGWGISKALKDAVRDAWTEAWPISKKLFATVFLRRFREEMDEWVDWNPGEDEGQVIVEIADLPIPGFRFLKIIPRRWRPRFCIEDLKKWTEG